MIEPVFPLAPKITYWASVTAGALLLRLFMAFLLLLRAYVYM